MFCVFPCTFVLFRILICTFSVLLCCLFPYTFVLFRKLISLLADASMAHLHGTAAAMSVLGLSMAEHHGMPTAGPVAPTGAPKRLKMT